MALGRRLGAITAPTALQKLSHLVPRLPVPVPDVLVAPRAEVRVRIVRLVRSSADDARPLLAKVALLPQLPGLPTPETRAHVRVRLARRLGRTPRAALLGALRLSLAPRGAFPGRRQSLTQHVVDPGVRSRGWKSEQLSEAGRGREQTEEFRRETGLVIERRGLFYWAEPFERRDPFRVQSGGVAGGQLQGDTWPLVVQFSGLFGRGRGRRSRLALDSADALAPGAVGDLHYLAEHERLVF